MSDGVRSLAAARDAARLRVAASPSQVEVDAVEVAALARGFWPPDAVDALAASTEVAVVAEVLGLLRARLPERVWRLVEGALEPVYGLPLPGSVAAAAADHPTLW